MRVFHILYLAITLVLVGFLTYQNRQQSQKIEGQEDVIKVQRTIMSAQRDIISRQTKIIEQLLGIANEPNNAPSNLTAKN